MFAAATHSVLLSIRLLKVLKGDRIPDETKSHAFKLLRKLAGASRRVPKSYLVGTLTRYQVNKDPFASGGFADVREGRLGGKVVAIKTIRTSLETNLDEILEVCKTTGRSILVDRLT